MAEEKSIFFRPKLEPEKDYLSEGDFFQTEERITIEETSEEKTDRAFAVISEFRELSELVSATLPEVAAVVNPVTKTLTERTAAAFPYGYNGPEQTEILPAVPVKKGENEDQDEVSESVAPAKYKNAVENTAEALFDGLFPEPTNIVLKVETPKSYIKIVSEKYKSDLLTLEEHYLHCLQAVFQRFYQQTLCVMAECGVTDIEHITMDFDGESVSVGQNNLLHLRDEAVRSQILREQKVRLLKKTHNVSNTVLVLRQWQAAEQLFERYYGEQFGNTETFLDTETDLLLGRLQKEYGKKYNQALLEVYKYLNSSVIKIEDILNMYLEEIKAKGKLLEAGINIFSVSGSTQR